MFSQIAPTLESAISGFSMLNFLSLNPNSFYHLDFKNIDKIFEKNVDLPNSVVGIHWYGGHPLTQKYNNQINHANLDDYDCTLCNKIKEVLNEL